METSTTTHTIFIPDSAKLPKSEIEFENVLGRTVLITSRIFEHFEKEFENYGLDIAEVAVTIAREMALGKPILESEKNLINKIQKHLDSRKWYKAIENNLDDEQINLLYQHHLDKQAALSKLC